MSYICHTKRRKQTHCVQRKSANEQAKDERQGRSPNKERVQLRINGSG